MCVVCDLYISCLNDVCACGCVCLVYVFVLHDVRKLLYDVCMIVSDACMTVLICV